jgi:RNA polymerase sigma factor (TIGR02999 family)
MHGRARTGKIIMTSYLPEILETPHGEPAADDTLVQAVEKSLRRIAGTKSRQLCPGHSFSPSELIREAWLQNAEPDFPAREERRARFMTAAAEAVRRILVDYASHQSCERDRGNLKSSPAHLADIAPPTANHAELLAVHHALARLATQSPGKAELVKLRYFAGFGVEEAAEVLGISVSTANRDWAYARAWLHCAITRGTPRDLTQPVQEVLCVEDASWIPSRETWCTSTWSTETWTR